MIHVVSIGRSGSTMLRNCIKRHGLDVDVRLGHPYPFELPKEAKVIFIYANAINVALSVRVIALAWQMNHYRNLKADIYLYNSTLDLDVLGLGRMFDAYNQKQDFELLMVKYEKLWEVKDEICKFLGKEISLPEYKQRPDIFSTLSEDEKIRVTKTYTPLIKRMNETPNIKIC